MHGMTVKVRSSCAQSDGHSTPKVAATKADLYGEIEISDRPFTTGMTLQAIRDVFGPEDENIIAQAGIDPLGTVHGPGGKGSVVYGDRAKANSAGGFTIIFTFPFQPSQQSPELSNRIIDSDVADGLIVREHAAKPLGHQ
jgi:hypothetical protein